MKKNGEYYEYIGCVHIHTTYSDGSKSLEDVAAIADSVGLDYILISDHMTLESREAGKEGYYGKTLTLIGYEHNDREDCNHYLLFGTEKVLPEDMSPVDYVAEGAHQGALGIIAHPDEIRPRLGKYPSYPWLAWDARGFDGIEIWNQMSEWMENLKPYNKLKMLFSPRKFLQTPTDRILKKWDELNVERKIAGIGPLTCMGFHTSLARFVSRSFHTKCSLSRYGHISYCRKSCPLILARPKVKFMKQSETAGYLHRIIAGVMPPDSSFMPDREAGR